MIQIRNVPDTLHRELEVRATQLHVPEHFNVEALSALRRYARRGELPQVSGVSARLALS